MITNSNNTIATNPFIQFPEEITKVIISQLDLYDQLSLLRVDKFFQGIVPKISAFLDPKCMTREEKQVFVKNILSYKIKFEKLLVGATWRLEHAKEYDGDIVANCRNPSYNIKLSETVNVVVKLVLSDSYEIRLSPLPLLRAQFSGELVDTTILFKRVIGLEIQSTKSANEGLNRAVRNFAAKFRYTY